MTLRSAFRGKMDHTFAVEVGTLSRFPDVPGTAASAPGCSAAALWRWFGSCSVRIPVTRAFPLLALSLAVFLASGFTREARADGSVPPPTEIPAVLSMADALQIFRARGLDLLIAEAAVRSAEGDVGVAGAVPNPVVNGGYGRVLNYDTTGCPQCSANYWAVGLSDSAAIEDALSGKRGLRLKVARNALAAARLSRVDAQRTLEFQVKSAYLQIAQAVLAYHFAKEVVDSNQKTLELFQARLKAGAINEGDLARVETQKLESDQALDAATEALRQARVALAFLIGVRGIVPTSRSTPASSRSRTRRRSAAPRRRPSCARRSITGRTSSRPRTRRHRRWRASTSRGARGSRTSPSRSTTRRSARVRAGRAGAPSRRR